MARAADAAGARFAIVIFPYQAQVEGQAPASLQQRLTALGRDAGWETVDVLAAFRAAAAEGPLFIDIYHPTATGHRVAADAIVVQLGCRALLPGGCPSDGG
jgi:hypothetical protein